MPPQIEAQDMEDLIGGLRPNDFVIFLLGRVGVGKSYLIDAFANEEGKRANCLTMPKTTEITATWVTNSEHKQSRVVLAEAPGFDHPKQPDDSVLDKVEGCLKSIKEKGITVGVIYLHSVTQDRPARPESYTWLRLRRIFSFEIKQGRLMFLTTMWGKVTLYKGSEREDQMRTTVWKMMIDGGALVRQLPASCSHEDAWNMARDLRSGHVNAERQNGEREMEAGRDEGRMEKQEKMGSKIRKAVANLFRKIKKRMIKSRD